jgi:predicted nucleic acid-binding protein
VIGFTRESYHASQHLINDAPGPAAQHWPSTDLARRIIPTVYPIAAETLDLARSLLDRHPRLAARDALHAAVCQEGGFAGICSLDRDFDQIRGLKRLEPSHVRAL